MPKYTSQYKEKNVCIYFFMANANNVVAIYYHCVLYTPVLGPISYTLHKGNGH